MRGTNIYGQHFSDCSEAQIVRMNVAEELAEKSVRMREVVVVKKSAEVQQEMLLVTSEVIARANWMQRAKK